MPAKHFYFSNGAMLGSVIIVAVRLSRKWLYGRYHWFRRLYRIDRDWFLYFPAVIGLFGLFGLIPDILYAIGILPKHVIRSEFFNLFLGYSWFESVEDLPEYRHLNQLWNWSGELSLLLISVGTIVFYIRVANSIKYATKKEVQKNRESKPCRIN